MAAEICVGSDKVTWRHWRELAERIDALAVTLSTPGYERLVDDPSMPFIEEDLPHVTGTMEFEVTPGLTVNECPTVISRAILTGWGGDAVCFAASNMTGATYHPFYLDYINAGRLFFVHEADGCLCKTIFKIVEEAACKYGLEYVSGGSPEFGCCQTITVPVVGETLGYYQHFVPASYSCQWGDINGINRTDTDDTMDLIGVNTIYCPDCAGGMDGCQFSAGNNYVEYKFTPVPEPGRRSLTHVTRYLSGYLTWPILKEHMDALMDKLDYILQCDKNDGLRPQDLSHSPYTVDAGNDGYIRTNPTLWRKDQAYEDDGGRDTEEGWHMWGWSCGAWDIKAWFASLNFEFNTFGHGAQDETKSGNIVQPAAGDVGALSRCSDTARVPWVEKTGGAELCGVTNEYKVYCETLNRIADLIETIGKRLWPEGSFPEVALPALPECEDEEKTCCYTNNCETNILESVCIAAGGTPMDGSCSEECCPEEFEGMNASVCAGTPNPDCEGELIYNCTWDQNTCHCECPSIDWWECSDNFPESYYCCCPTSCVAMYGEPGGANPCESPCYAVLSCSESAPVVTACYHPDDPYYPCTCSQESNGCDAPCVYCSEYGPHAAEEGCDSCSFTPVMCMDSIVPPPTPQYYEPLAPSNDECGDCSRQCCLKHAAFEELTYGCVEYKDEIIDFVISATAGTFTTADYINDEIYPGPPDCEYLYFSPAYCESYLPSEMEMCMNQAAFDWELVPSSTAGWYTLRVKALAAAP